MSELTTLVQEYEKFVRLANEARSRILAVLSAAGLPATLLAPPAGQAPLMMTTVRLDGVRKKGQAAKEVLELMRQRGGQVTLRDLGVALGHAERSSVLTTLRRLIAAGQVVKASRGLYALAGTPGITPVVRKFKGNPARNEARDAIAGLSARFPTLTPTLVAKQLGITPRIAASTLNRCAHPGKGKTPAPPILVLVKKGVYASIHSSAAAVAAFRYAIVDEPQSERKSRDRVGVGLREKILALAKKYGTLTSDLVSRELHIRRGYANMSLADLAIPKAKRRGGGEPSLKRMGPGIYVSIDDPRAEAAPSPPHPKSWLKKPHGEEQPEPPKNSEPATPHE